MGNPLKYTDPSGHGPCDGGGAEGNEVLLGCGGSAGGLPAGGNGAMPNPSGDGPADLANNANVVQQPEPIGPGVQLRLPGPEFEIPGDYGGALDGHATMRQDLGLPTAGTPGAGVVSKLEIGPNTFWGVNAHGQDVSAWQDLHLVNPVTLAHAEGDVFNQAAEAGVVGGDAHLTVDAALCGYCGQSGGVRSMARFLELRTLMVTTPFGTYEIPLW